MVVNTVKLLRNSLIGSNQYALNKSDSQLELSFLLGVFLTEELELVGLDEWDGC